MTACNSIEEAIGARGCWMPVCVHKCVLLIPGSSGVKRDQGSGAQSQTTQSQTRAAARVKPCVLTDAGLPIHLFG